MSGWVQYLKLTAKAKTGLSSAVVIAAAIAARPGLLVVLVSTSTPAQVVIARSTDVALSAQQLLTVLTAEFGGRGGGRPELAQGGGLLATPAAIFDAIRARI
jgi:alanyl-tRNA synthetase